MMTPTIHLNGTSKERLTESYCGASIALEAAYEVMKATCPNGRDYYPQGHLALSTAIDEHMDRLRRLYEIKKEIDDLSTAIDLQ